MERRFPALWQMAAFGLASALTLAAWAPPARAFHRERKTVQRVVAAYKEVRHHLEEARPDWRHVAEELRGVAKPIRSLGHHDEVDLFKPLEASVRRRDREALEEGFRKVFLALMRENLHRSEDSAGGMEKTVKGFIGNARMAYGPLAAAAGGKANGRVERILLEMEDAAREAQALKARLAAKREELEARLRGALKP